MAKKFPHNLDMGASEEVKYNRTVTRFGDGYAQYHYTGINNKNRTWTGNKTGDLETVIKPIMDFIDEHAGVTPFLWTDPFGIESLYTCAGYSTPQRKGNFWQIALNFEQFTSV